MTAVHVDTCRLNLLCNQGKYQDQGELRCGEVEAQKKTRKKRHRLAKAQDEEAHKRGEGFLLFVEL